MSPTISPATITYEQLMALFLEDREQMKEIRLAQKKHSRLLQKHRLSMQELRQLLKEQALAREKANKELDQKISKLGDRLGELVAAMVEGGVVRMFHELGYKFDACIPRRPFGNDDIGKGEIDLLLENGEYALLVEVKTNLSVADIREHQERLQKFRSWIDRHGDQRRLLAAVGGGVVREAVRIFALNQGMFVVQQSGENVEVIPPEGKPKVW